MKKIFFALLFVLCSAHAEQTMLVYNTTTDKYIFSQNVNQTRPMASITKLMTAMVTLDYDKDLGKRLRLSTRVKSNLPQQSYTRYDLLNAMLVRSDNAAAETLADDYPGGRKAFIQRMNKTAAAYKMHNTFFDDPTGLSNKNVSTGLDVTSLVEAASGYWLIRETSTKKQVAFETKYGKKIRTIQLDNTNKSALFEFDEIVVSKTGFTTPAGWCVAMAVEKNKQRYIVIVMGTKSKADRLKAVEGLMYNHLNDFDLGEDPWKL